MNSLSTDSYRVWLKKYTGANIYLVHYPGNQGDKLIIQGSHVLLTKLDCKLVANPIEADLRIYPGGNITLWRSDVKALKYAVKGARGHHFAVGPSGFPTSPYNVISYLGQDCVKGVFARDPKSYRNIEAVPTSSTREVALANDPAFHLLGSDWLGDLKQNASEQHVLLSFREDREGDLILPKLSSYILPLIPYTLSSKLSKFITRNSNNDKASVRISGASLPVVKRDASRASYEDFINLIQGSAEIHTNRLHVFILAAMLDKLVYVYDTPSNKIAEIYNYSMRDWYQRCTFV